MMPASSWPRSPLCIHLCKLPSWRKFWNTL